MIEACLLIPQAKTAIADDRAYCAERFRGHDLTVPDFFDGPPANLVEDIPVDGGWHFSKWQNPGDDHYLVCHYGPSLKIVRRVQKGATACLFGDGREKQSVSCR